MKVRKGNHLFGFFFLILNLFNLFIAWMSLLCSVGQEGRDGSDHQNLYEGSH